MSAMGELRKLEILCFLGSKIKELPREIRNLSYLELLDLTRCLEIDCHVARDKVLAKVIKSIHVRTQCQLADLLTKALSLINSQSLFPRWD